jgi:capsular exopolysaccharide synthesis family protein
MEPIEYLRIARRRWALIVACVVIALAAAWATTPAHPRSSKPITSYNATATLLQATTNNSLSLNYIALFVTAGDIPVRAAKDLGYTGDPQVLASSVTVRPDPTVGALAISGSGSNGTDTADTVNAFARETIAYFRDQAQTNRQELIKSAQSRLDALASSTQQLDAQVRAHPGDPLVQARRDAQVQQYQAVYTQMQDLLGKPVQGTQLALLQKATPIPVVSSGFVAPSSRASRLAIAFFVALLLGFGLAVGLERLDTRLRRRADVQRALGTPVLAEVPRTPRGDRRHNAIISVSDPVSHVADAYRNLRSALLLTPSLPLHRGRRRDEDRATVVPAADSGTGMVVLVTSARAREGKTTSVANIAASLAEAGRRVLVLDCDFRHPDAHHYLDVPDSPGISDLLLDDHVGDIETLVRPTAVEGVSMITAGLRVEQPTLLPTRMDQVLKAARQLADIVLIDCAPLLHANDALDLMPFVDSVLVVCKSGRATREQAERVAELLARMQVPVVGALLVGSRVPVPRWGEDSYRYHTSSSAVSSSRNRRRHERAIVRSAARTRGRDTSDVGTEQS